MELYLYERKTIENRSWFLAKCNLALYRVSGFFRLVTPYVRNKVVPLPYGTDQATTRHSSGCAYRQLRCCKF